jgi:hypothetical protein
MDNKTIAMVETLIELLAMRRRLTLGTDLWDVLLILLEDDIITDEEADQLNELEYLQDALDNTREEQREYERISELEYDAWLTKFIEERREVL